MAPWKTLTTASWCEGREEAGVSVERLGSPESNAKEVVHQLVDEEEDHVVRVGVGDENVEHREGTLGS